MSFAHLGFQFVRVAFTAILFASFAVPSGAQDQRPNKFIEARKESLAHVNAVLDDTIIPRVKFKNTPFFDAVQEIRVLSGNDESNDERMSIVFKVLPDVRERLKSMTVTLDLQNAPLRQALEAMVAGTDLKVLVEPAWVVLTEISRPKDTNSQN